MTDPADVYRAITYAARAIPGQYGLRPHTVTIIRSMWPDGHTGDGVGYSDETPITEAIGQSPKVRWLSQEELALASLPSGSCTIGPITPNLGLDLKNLTEVFMGGTIAVRIVGPQHPHGALYRITQINAERALHYTLVAKPLVEVTTTP